MLSSEIKIKIFPGSINLFLLLDCALGRIDNDALDRRADGPEPSAVRAPDKETTGRKEVEEALSHTKF